MKITNKPRFICGIINVALSVALTVIVIIRHSEQHKLLIALLCFMVGVMTIIDSIETKKQHQKRIEELRKKYEWLDRR